MKAWTLRMVAAGILGLGVLALAPANDGVTAAEPVPAEAVVMGDLDACLEHAAAEFQRCRRHGHSVVACIAWARERFNICRNGGDGGGGNPE